MIVTLNGKTLDVTLEKERTLGEFLAAMEEWLEKSNYTLSAFDIDGKTIAAEGVEEACIMELDEIKELDLKASSWNELLKEAIAIGVSLLEEGIAEWLDARNSGRKPELASLLTRFVESPAYAFLGGRAADLQEVIEKALSSGGADPERTMNEALQAAKERGREVESPILELERFRSLLIPLAQRLEELPLDLQTGKDGLAAMTFRDFSVAHEKLIRLIPLLKSDGILLEDKKVADTGFRAFIEEMGAALRELTAAYENGDAVLVGDLAEYELAPRMKSLEKTLSEIKITQ